MDFIYNPTLFLATIKTLYLVYYVIFGWKIASNKKLF